MTEDRVDPRAPRFGQSLTASLLVVGVVLQEPAVLAVVAAILLTAVLTQWRVDLYAVVWKRAMIPLLGPPSNPEPASPHRFAKLIGATGTTLATGLVLAGAPTAGYVVAAAVAVAAGLAAATGICLGCRMYRQVSFARRLGIV